MDGLEGFLGHGLVLDCSIAECFHIAIDDRQRRAEFMGDIADKLAPHGFQRANRRDILKHNQRRAGFGFVLGRQRGDMQHEDS